MKLNTLAPLLVLTLAIGCGYGSKYNGNMMGGGALSVSQLAPNNVIAGSGSFTLTVDGSGFTSNSVIYWNMVPHNARMVSSTRLTTTITDNDIANPGTIPVYVRTNNQNSNTVSFTVD